MLAMQRGRQTVIRGRPILRRRGLKEDDAPEQGTEDTSTTAT